MSPRAYIVANTLVHKLIKLFYKIFKKVVVIVFDCAIICLVSFINKITAQVLAVLRKCIDVS